MVRKRRVTRPAYGNYTCIRTELGPSTSQNVQNAMLLAMK